MIIGFATAFALATLAVSARADTASAVGNVDVARVCVTMVDYAVEVSSLFVFTDSGSASDRLREIDGRVAMDRALAGIVLGPAAHTLMFGESIDGKSFVAFADECVADDVCRQNDLMTKAAGFAMKLKASCDADYKGRS